MTSKFVLFACAALIAASAVASDKTDALVPVHQFVDGMNKGDMKAIVAAFADEASIIDDMAPYHWQGKGATDRWVATMDDTMRKSGSADLVMKLGKPSYFQIDGDMAYTVIPSTFTYKVKGKKISGSNTMTFVLRKGTGGWRATAFAAAAH